MRLLLPAAIRRKDSPRHPRNAGNGLGITRISVTLPHLPPGMDGFRIAQMSDLHLKEWTSERDVRRAVDLCSFLKPDLVALTGDFTTFSTRHIGLLGEMLAPLHAPHGVFACLGNHDFWADPGSIERTLRERRITVLRNETRQVHTDRGVLHVAGLDSRYVGRPDIRRTLADWRSNQPLVMMMHEPDVADCFAAAGIEGLQLAGHTHGGQIRLMNLPPMALRLPRWGRKYLAGHYHVGPLQLYVNRGVGCVTVPLRIGCPPEVTEVTLRSAEAHGN